MTIGSYPKEETEGMTKHRIGTREEWLAARLELLEAEKELTRRSDELARRRRELPWTRVEKSYSFDAPEGRRTLAQLFGDCSQLLVYHFMFGPDWEAGCKSCSFWADNFNGIDVHLRHRDVSFLAISHAPLAKIEAYKKRMGWTFTWVSSCGSDFNFDYGISFKPEDVERGPVVYNYVRQEVETEMPGASAFFKDDDATVYHTYSTYGRGLDVLNGAYQYLDLVPKGRDEDGLSWTMAWLHRHDEYDKR
jgi:predicted dithiol-disulfide oxidoreductase (DUF899 family)